MKAQTFDYSLEKIGIDTYRDYQKAHRDNPPIGKVSNRENLYWQRRYGQGSYKARKAGIGRPSVMMRYGNDRFRLYGSAESNKLYDKAKGILAGWKAREKEARRAYKLWLKSHKRDAVSFDKWLLIREWA